MKKFWYRFLIIALSIGMLVPTWLTVGATKAKAATLTPIIIDDAASGLTKSSGWSYYNGLPNGGINDDYYYESDGTTTKWARWTPNIIISEDYDVYVHWSVHSARPSDVAYKIYYQGGVDEQHVDQTQDSNGIIPANFTASGWKLIGRYPFAAGNYVELTESSSGDTCVDAVKFIHNNELPSVPVLQSPENNKNTNQTTIDFSWLASTDADDTVLTYDFQLYKNSILENNQTSLGSTSINAASLTDGNYTWRVRSFDGENYSNWSEYFSFTLDTTIPAAPANLIASVGNGEVSLTWDAVAGADYYNIYYQKFSDLVYSGPIATTQTSTKITQLENGTMYRFIVRAVRIVGTIAVESPDAWLEATPIAPRIVLAAAPKEVVVEPAAPEVQPQVEPQIEEPTEQGKILGEKEEATEEEKINWTPWIILFILIILAGAAAGGYFYWFGREEEEIISKEVVEKSKEPTKRGRKSTKTSVKRNKRW